MTTRKPIRAGASLTERVLEVMRANPGRTMTTAEVAPMAGLTQKQTGNVLTRSAALGRIDRKDDGYVYLPGMDDRPIRRGRTPKAEETPADLRPITDYLDDDVFKEAGLRPVGMAADGSRVCVDDQGQAWRVRVTIEARLV